MPGTGGGSFTGGTVPNATTFQSTLTVGTAAGAAHSITVDGTNSTITAEGATADAFETTLAFGDATADHTLTLTGGSGIVEVKSDATSDILFAPAGGYAAFCVEGQVVGSVRVRGDAVFGFTSGLPTAGLQVGFSRIADTILKVNAGSAASNGWLVQSAGNKRVASNATNATATMSNLTDLSVTLVAGRTYNGRLVLYCADSVAGEGVKVDFDGGAATATTFRAHGKIFDAALLSSTQTTAIATDFAVATITGDGVVEVDFAITVNAAGTFIPRFSQNTHATGTATVYAGSYLTISDVP